jgi:lipopolysaccharide transport system ATP-binding protein
MSDIAIKIENLSKLYQLGEVGTGTISKDLNRWWAKMRGNEDPYAKIGQVNDRTKKAESDFVWALKDINFEVKQGEVLGIIGRNGAGKSTLLKILSKITSPTIGKIYTKGRIASLLEVGTGFHPEMTGRENIYLNGAILGMRKWEIEKKFDEIVDFAGIEAYIDTPVKRYSSGMYVRLAFAVSAFLEPEILIVDEVLAVGDAEFQKKCLGRMKDVSVNDGRTVLFVSHNILALQNLCQVGLLLQNGQNVMFSEISTVLNKYHENNTLINKWQLNSNQNSNNTISYVEVIISGKQPNLKLNIITKVKINICIEKKGFLAFYIGSQDSMPLMEAIPQYDYIDCSKNGTIYRIETQIDLNACMPGIYTLGVWFGVQHTMQMDWQKEVVQFEIKDSPIINRTVAFPKHAGFIVPPSQITSVNHKVILD